MVFVATTERAGIALLREARRQGMQADFFGGDGWTGVVAEPAVSEGVYVGAPFTASDPRPEAQRFVTAFTAKYGSTPDGNAALAYDATILLARAIAEKGGNRAEVRSYLAMLNSASAHRGVTGPIFFNTGGDPVGKGFVMTRIHDGELHVAEGAR
jgi:branched-chain amino acid transport system substrate-binding protein